MSLIRASLRISSRCLTSSFSRSISTSSRLLSDVPAADGAEKPSPKVEKLVSEIMELSLFESISLSKALQKAMGLDGVPMSFGAPAAAAPAAAAPAAAAAAKPAEEKKEEVAAKTSFSVRLDSFDQKDKIKVIKEIRTATGLGLKESKELVESVPKVFKKDLKKDEADALVAKLKEAGAKCSLE